MATLNNNSNDNNRQQKTINQQTMAAFMLLDCQEHLLPYWSRDVSNDSKTHHPVYRVFILVVPRLSNMTLYNKQSRLQLTSKQQQNKNNNKQQ